MKRYSRRQYLQGLFATSVFLALSQPFVQGESGLPKAANLAFEIGHWCRSSPVTLETKTKVFLN